MPGKYVRRKQARKITLSLDSYLRCEQGRWQWYRRVQATGGTSTGSVWQRLPISPIQARRMLLAAGIETEAEA